MIERKHDLPFLTVRRLAVLLAASAAFFVSACQTTETAHVAPECEMSHQEFVADALQKIPGLNVVKLAPEQRDRFVEDYNEQNPDQPIDPYEVYVMVSQFYSRAIIEGASKDGCLDGYVFVPAGALSAILSTYRPEDSI